MEQAKTEALVEAVMQDLLRLSTVTALSPEEAAPSLARCRDAMQAGRAAQAIPVLQRLNQLCPGDAAIAQLLGVALRLEQRLTEAEAVFADARRRLPDVPHLTYGLAQTRYELGLSAAGLFADAQSALPGDLDIVRNRATAMAAEGDEDGALALLRHTLSAHPAWLDGHKALSTLLWTSGDTVHFADSYAAACAQEPGNAALWLAWFQAVVLTKNWASCREILERAACQLGETPAITTSRLFVACESGDAAAADLLLARTAHIQGDTINLTRIRHNIRQGRLKEAEGVALPLLLSRWSSLFWPYLSVIWRLMGDERHLWIDRPDAVIKPVDVDLSVADMAELTDVLRALHVMQKPYIEQSVRGGTQTDRSVILRHEPILQRARSRCMDAIRAYIADLPPHEQGHPLLGTPRNHLLIEGSWSVRLVRQGYNVPHTHPMGWLSTAFYVALPEPAKMGPAPAGHIEFGRPPEDLGLDLRPYCDIEPRVGRCAIFPSTMWHGTVPFEDGERLVMALDIRTPTY